MVNFQKLSYLQRLYAEQYAEEDGVDMDRMVQSAIEVVEGHKNLQIPSGRELHSYVRAILKADAKSYSPLKGFFERHKSFFLFDLDRDGITNGTPDHAELVVQAYRKLRDVPLKEWSRDTLHEKLDQVVTQAQMKESETAQDDNKRKKQLSSDLLHGLRQIVMASRPGPPMADCLQILGRDTALARLGRIEQVLNSAPEAAGQTPQYASNAA